MAGALLNAAGSSLGAEVLRVCVPVLVEALSFDIMGGLAVVMAGHAKATERRSAVFAAREAEGERSDTPSRSHTLPACPRNTRTVALASDELCVLMCRCFP